MSYKALYREYRPETFDEVVGQSLIVKTLQNAIANNKLAHAYLFCGPRGTGKTTIAKLLAKAVNCTSENKPCGHCDHCKAISNGSFSDVIEIDAASNNGVSEVRELIEKAKYAPLESKYKVYIIDEVHMMSSNAFNALLKTLEEPPEHVIFIFATTEPNRVLPTIISRCQRFDFSKVSENDIVFKIRSILNHESINYEADVPQLIASLCDGGVRDALSILDQSIAYAGTYLTSKAVRDIYGVLSKEELVEFIESCHNSDILKSLALLSKYSQRGIDISRLCNNLIDCFKDFIIYNSTNSNDVLKILTPAEVTKLANSLDCEQCFKYIDILMDAALNFKRVSSVQSYFELTTLKLCNINKDTVAKKPIIHDKKEEFTQVSSLIEEQKETNTFIDNSSIDEDSSILDSFISSDNSPIKETVIETIETPFVHPTAQEAKKDENNPYSSLFKEETSDIVTTKPVEKSIEEINKIEPKVEAKKVPFVSVNMEIILNYLVNCTKDDKNKISNIWSSINSYLTDPNHSEAAKVLRDSELGAAGPSTIVIEVDFQHTADKINSLGLYFKVRALLKEIFDVEYKVLAITFDTFKKARVEFATRRASGTLREHVDLKDFYQESDLGILEEVENDSNKQLETSKNIFGDLLEIK